MYITALEEASNLLALLVMLARRSALIKWFTWPAPACRHRDAPVETTGLSQVTRDLRAYTKAKAQQDSVEVSRHQH